ncbi:MAG TPA: hypothetical protein VFS00_22630, partial [Polyangiaceae bacterium]|nr:hypothetical protein [Polyangiaceae bacterium]
ADPGPGGACACAGKRAAAGPGGGDACACAGERVAAGPGGDACAGERAAFGGGRVGALISAPARRPAASAAGR